MATKNLFTTRTFLASVAFFLTEADPLLEAMINAQHVAASDWMRLLKILLFALTITFLRHDTEAIAYTPHGFPGRDPEQADNIWEKEIDRRASQYITEAQQQQNTWDGKNHGRRY